MSNKPKTQPALAEKFDLEKHINSKMEEDKGFREAYVKILRETGRETLAFVYRVAYGPKYAKFLKKKNLRKKARKIIDKTLGA